MPDGDGHGLTQHPLVGGRGRIVIVQTPVRGVVPVHGVPRRPERRLVGPQIDLPVTHRVERPGLRDGLSRGVLQKTCQRILVLVVLPLVLKEINKLLVVTIGSMQKQKPIRHKLVNCFQKELSPKSGNAPQSSPAGRCYERWNTPAAPLIFPGEVIYSCQQIHPERAATCRVPTKPNSI